MPPAGLGDGVRSDFRVRGAPVLGQPWSRWLASSRHRWTQAPARQEGALGGQADEATRHGGGEEAGGEVLKRFILMCCGGRVILQEAACIKISRPVDWSVTVICGSSPEVMGSNWARRRRPDRLPSRTGGGLAAGKIY